MQMRTCMRTLIFKHALIYIWTRRALKESLKAESKENNDEVSVEKTALDLISHCAAGEATSQSRRVFDLVFHRFLQACMNLILSDRWKHAAIADISLPLFAFWHIASHCTLHPPQCLQARNNKVLALFSDVCLYKCVALLRVQHKCDSSLQSDDNQGRAGNSSTKDHW